MANELTGKTALVTGAAKRIGRSTALALANAGANVVVHYRSSANEADEVVEQIKALGTNAWRLKADIANHIELGRLIDESHDLAGGLDILINSASIFPTGDFAEVTLNQLQENININAWGPFVLARKFAEKSGRGHIVNFLDTRVVGYDWSHVAYHASKYLLGLFTRMMAIRFAPGICVNAVAPGLILPPEGKDQSYLESLKDTTLLKRTGSAKEVADAVLFLVKSDFITGQTIFVDGGRHLKEVNLG